MLHWIPYAFIRITACFMGGILLAIHAPDCIPESFAVAGLGSLVLLYFVLVFINRRDKRVVVNPGFIGLTAIFVSGYLTLLLHTDSRKELFFGKASNFTYYRALLVSMAEEKPRSWKQVVQLQQVYTDGGWKNASGKVLIYYANDPGKTPYNYGDEVVIRGAPVPVPGPGNPGEFDYRRYLSFQNISHQHFIKENEIFFLRHVPQNRVMDLAISIRLWANNVFARSIDGTNERAIANALVLGITEGLDREMTGAYAATGAMHVLAVSGLHVGIIYMIVGFILKPLKKVRHGKWMLCVISMTILWGYACVTGLSPSVLRAVTMFSFVAVAQPLHYRTNIFNTLAASAFFLLIFNPFLIMSVGFQLSYLAVLGIVYLHPLLYNLYEPSSRILDEIWKISCVSIAAQLATFSIGIFYFHQFPNYFLISNLFVIPLAFAVLCGGLVLLGLSWMEPLAEWIGFLLENTIRFLNFLIFRLESLPFGLLQDLRITAFQCWMLLGVVVFITVFLQYRKIGYFYTSALMLVALSIDAWLGHHRNAGQATLMVYKISGHTAYDILENGRAYYFYDSALEKKPDKIDFHIQPARLGHGTVSVHKMGEAQFARPLPEGILISRRGKTILHLRSLPHGSDSLYVDFLILSDNVTGDLNAILRKINASKIILDGSNSYFVVDKVLNSLPEQVQVHSVWHQGAFEAKL